MEKYRVSKFIDEIKKVTKEKIEFNDYVIANAFYRFFETYEEAKNYLIKRNNEKILRLEKELKALRKKMPKLENLTEKIKAK